MTKDGLRTAQELASRCQINRQTIHRWLTESANNIDPKLLFRVADALHISARWLATGKGSMGAPRELTPDQEAVLEMAANLDRLADGSKDHWMKDGAGRLDTARVRATKHSYPTTR